MWIAAVVALLVGCSAGEVARDPVSSLPPTTATTKRVVAALTTIAEIEMATNEEVGTETTEPQAVQADVAPVATAKALAPSCPGDIPDRYQATVAPTAEQAQQRALDLLREALSLVPNDGSAANKLQVNSLKDHIADVALPLEPSWELACRTNGIRGAEACLVVLSSLLLGDNMKRKFRDSPLQEEQTLAMNTSDFAWTFVVSDLRRQADDFVFEARTVQSMCLIKR
jgi:hypothetical protein